MTDQPGCDCSICDEDYSVNLENQPPKFKVPAPTLNLTDRIAAVIQRWLDNNLDDLPGEYVEWIHTPTLAAAVVEELGRGRTCPLDHHVCPWSLSGPNGDRKERGEL